MNVIYSRLLRVVVPILCLPFLLVGGPSRGDLKAGFGRRQITPPIPIPMAGFANRSKPAESVGGDLWTKALAIQDAAGQKVIILTVELAAIPKPMLDMVAARVMAHNGIDRAHLVINLSHTHSGPVVGWRSNTDREMRLRILAYRNKVIDSMAEAADDAVRDLKPARISYAAGKVSFPHNRRQPVPGGGWTFGVNPNGPSDPAVPVLRFYGPGGKLRGVLFGLSCHPSVLTYESLVISGDYAGIAQAAWEKAHRGATAVFLQLCGGDQNANPRRTMELAEKYGNELASEVDRVIGQPMKAVRAPLKAAMLTTELPFASFSLDDFAKQAKESKEALIRRHAESMLKQYESGNAPLPGLPYTMQAFQFGKDLTLLTMNGEVVVDYALRVKKEFGADGMIVAGYSNDRPCYIPSLRVLKEGGYEARDSILMTGLPGILGDQVEEVIFTGIRSLMETVGRAPVH